VWGAGQRRKRREGLDLEGGGFVQDVNYCGCPAVTCMSGARGLADLSAHRWRPSAWGESPSASRPPPALRRRRRPTCRRSPSSSPAASALDVAGFSPLSASLACCREVCPAGALLGHRAGRGGPGWPCDRSGSGRYVSISKLGGRSGLHKVRISLYINMHPQVSNRFYVKFNNIVDHLRIFTSRVGDTIPT
jgi:hypothetical protein